MGVPKTIDNDLACTELTFGFITALDIATDALDRLHTTAESHERVMILEVMGRNTGWIAFHSGIAGGADVILIPEIPFTMQSVADRIRARDAAGSNFSIVVIAEGALETGHDLIYQDKGDPQHAPRLGGIGAYCQRELEHSPARKHVASCLDICKEVGGPTLSIECWRRIMDRARCAPWWKASGRDGRAAGRRRDHGSYQRGYRQCQDRAGERPVGANSERHGNLVWRAG